MTNNERRKKITRMRSKRRVWSVSKERVVEEEEKEQIDKRRQTEMKRLK